MEKTIFLLLLCILAVIDYRRHEIPNVIVIPGIAAGIWFTGHWAWALSMFLAGVLLTYYNPKLGRFDYTQKKSIVMKPDEHIIYGGDVKLMAMLGAFLGVKSVAVIVFTAILIQSYRMHKYLFMTKLPVAPFALAVSLLFLW